MGVILDRRTNQGPEEGRERERGEMNMHLARDACLTFARYWATTPLWATARRSPRTFDGEEEEQEEEGVRGERGVSYHPMPGYRMLSWVYVCVCVYLHKFPSWMFVGAYDAGLDGEKASIPICPMRLYLAAP